MTLNNNKTTPYMYFEIDIALSIQPTYSYTIMYISVVKEIQVHVHERHLGYEFYPVLP